ncbi:MAG TPA: helix-hairpin-helix domain-containing protein [Gemmatimonadaceae bacterium]|nr:helix-hairpin-helix domain-containing protein [Gemmatimonadaceae bacterium]
MTASERNALLFLSALLLLGVSVRLVRARATEVHATSQEHWALATQLASVDSARTAAKAAKGGSGSSTRRRSGQTGTGARPGMQDKRFAAPYADPPLRPNPGNGAPAPDSRSQIRGPVDLDLAPRADIDALPWIGPVLAARIVADRDSLGPFGSMEGFQRVKGVGPGMARRLAGRVTFSQTPRHFRVEDRGSRAPIRARHQPPVRPHAP